MSGVNVSVTDAQLAIDQLTLAAKSSGLSDDNQYRFVQQMLVALYEQYVSALAPAKVLEYVQSIQINLMLERDGFFCRQPDLVEAMGMSA